MTPLHTTATLVGPIGLPYQPIALDALLGAALCLREGIDPAATAAECAILPIPLAVELEGRYYLASAAVGTVERRALGHTHQRFPVDQAQMFGREMGTIKITAGATKSYRIPREESYLVDDRLEWWAVGDLEVVRDLLGWVTHLGRKRSVGLGRVAHWTVEPCEPWGDGFPTVRDGVPLRTLPADHPMVDADWPRQLGVLAPPYWLAQWSEPCVQPAWA